MDTSDQAPNAQASAHALLATGADSGARRVGSDKWMLEDALHNLAAQYLGFHSRWL